MLVRHSNKFETMVKRQMEDIANIKSCVRPLSSQYVKVRKKFMPRETAFGHSFDLTAYQSKTPNNRYIFKSYKKGYGEKILKKREMSQKSSISQSKGHNLPTKLHLSKKQERTMKIAINNATFINIAPYTKSRTLKEKPNLKFRKNRLYNHRKRRKSKDSRTSYKRILLSMGHNLTDLYGKDQVETFKRATLTKPEKGRKMYRELL
mmetsp:Transcript_22278/g.24779  ORF Transcript_22278/g.24779 Transcript_22278/m.24779 type:complete len:206 (-) Transcript_22278:17-634(-)